MSARGKARKRALDLLYASEMRSESPVEALDRAVADGEGPTNPYTADLVRAVTTHQGEIDRILSMYSESWTLERMPAVDRNVLRIGVYELLWSQDVPGAVAVSEALALVQSLSTDDSPTYVNGVLGAVLRDRSLLLADIAERASSVDETAPVSQEDVES